MTGDDPETVEETAEADDDEELVLGSEAMEPAPEPEETPAPEGEAPRVASGGGTLFERMSNLTRGGSSSSDDDEGE